MGSLPAISDASERVLRTRSLSADVEGLRFARRFAEPLRRLGIRTVRDLLLWVPHRYLDFTHVCDIAHADIGSDATIVGTVDKVALKRPRPSLPLVELSVLDGTGVMQVTFFRQPWIADQVKKGDTAVFSGKVTFGYGFRQMKSPALFEVLAHAEDDGGGEGASGAGAPAGAGSKARPSGGPAALASYPRILPIHPVTEGLSVAWMRRIISSALADRGDVCDFEPARLVARRHLMGLSRALRDVHFPPTMAAKDEARRRLAYDELLCLQLALLCRQTMELAGVEPFAHEVEGPHLAALRAALPFTLTDEQEQASEEILGDMAAPHVMNRLLLGDVGTGKTVVAALALAACADTGTQAAMMAPTSVLATQYAEKLGGLLDAAGVRWALLTGSTAPAERAGIRGRLAAGELDVIFGTTAMLSDDVRFRRLSLIVIDEQHRFGVDQRAALRRKGPAADMLTMTATPIPRTLALTFYGDLSVSRIRRRPKAGAGITTKSISPENADVALTAIREAVEAGHQAYVVCPLVDDADDGSALEDVPEAARSNARKLHSAASVAASLARDTFPDLEVGLLTGRTPAEERDDVMERFRAGTIDVLACTTVIEVGVDVPNATVMLVWDADRFGLATLHQLRGRVGRGDVAGTVYLACAAKKGTPARKRLDALEETSDGFKLAELDLELRHEGEVLGWRQSGGATLRIADLASDKDLVQWAHDDARELADEDPTLSSAELAPLSCEVRARFGSYFEEVERA